jgi:hypothetical protein
MFKYFFTSLVLSLILSGYSSAQSDHSIQLNAGLIKPMSSSEGLTVLVQYNLSLNQTFDFYTYTGYSAWDKYKITFLEEGPVTGNDQRFFDSYSSDDHILIPVYFGGRVNFYSNDLFHSFLNLEFGYSYLSYNSYNQIEKKNPETGKTEGYYPDLTTRKANRENLFGLGIGAGLSHPVSKNVSLVFSFKLNTYLNSEYNGLFSTRGTYTMFLGGFSYRI